MQPEQGAVGGPRVDGTLLAEIERRIGSRNFANWLEPASIDIQQDIVKIGVGSPFLLTWMQRQFKTVLQDVARTVLGPSATVRFEVDSTKAVASVSKAEPGERVSRASPAQPRPERTSGRQFADLKEFVVGGCNELAFTAGVQASQSPGERHNPVYIHSGVGAGKTHLIEGIYRATRKSHPTLQVLFVTAEAFANYFTRALRERTLPAFRQKFRNVDVLILDDAQFLDGKKVIQEEFLHTVKHLVSHARQVVIAADRHPRLLKKSSEELVSHLMAGLVCRIESPSLATRREIVDRKLIRSAADITPEARDFVARRFQNVRELEGALNCLDAYCSVSGRPVSQSTAARILSRLERDCVRVIRMTDVERVVCETFGVDCDEIRSSSRSRRLAQARRVAVHLSRKLANSTYSEIGRHFGGRNHSTVMSAERKLMDELKSGTTVQAGHQNWDLEELLVQLESELMEAG